MGFVYVMHMYAHGLDLHMFNTGVTGFAQVDEGFRRFYLDDMCVA